MSTKGGGMLAPFEPIDQYPTLKYRQFASPSYRFMKNPTSDKYGVLVV
jgi:hypothetical protein